MKTKTAANCPLCGEKVYAVGRGQLVPGCTCMFGDSWKDGKFAWKDLEKKKMMTDWYNNLIEENEREHVTRSKG